MFASGEGIPRMSSSSGVPRNGTWKSHGDEMQEQGLSMRGGRGDNILQFLSLRQQYSASAAVKKNALFSSCTLTEICRL
jgi:hypothetical protein